MPRIPGAKTTTRRTKGNGKGKKKSKMNGRKRRTKSSKNKVGLEAFAPNKVIKDEINYQTCR